MNESQPDSTSVAVSSLDSIISNIVSKTLKPLACEIAAKTLEEYAASICLARINATPPIPDDAAKSILRAAADHAIAMAAAVRALASSR